MKTDMIGTYFVPPEGTANVTVRQTAAPGAVKRTVAFLGGSITEMDGFRPRVMKALRARYPQVDFTEIAAGLSSTGSDAGAFRLAEDVLTKGKPDLFVIEAAVNDDQDGHLSRTRCIRGMEGIVRQALLEYPNCAVVIGLMVNEGQYTSLANGVLPMQYDAHAEVARHYGAAVADVGTALADSAKAGGFSWKEYGDCHPSPAGCDFAAKVVTEAIETVFDPFKPRGDKLPPPLDKKSYFRATSMSAESLELGPGWSVSRPDWESIEGSKRSYFTRDSAIWSETPGAKLDFSFCGTAAAAFLTAGPDAGALEVSVDGGMFVRMPLRADYGSLHYPYVHFLADDLADKTHHMTLRVAATERAGRSCTAIRIHRLFVNGDM